jgi:hypothetical protein
MSEPECVHREIQPKLPRRSARSAHLLDALASARPELGLADELQRRATAQLAREHSAGRIQTADSSRKLYFRTVPLTGSLRRHLASVPGDRNERARPIQPRRSSHRWALRNANGYTKTPPSQPRFDIRRKREDLRWICSRGESDQRSSLDQLLDSIFFFSRGNNIRSSTLG